jgi:KaiC/GvpD/RAD55 family RecA-like ATPase
LLVGLPFSYVSVPNVRVGVSYADAAIAIDPHNPLSIVIADGALYSSHDSGASWSMKGVSVRGNPSVAYDKNGMLFYVGVTGRAVSHTAQQVIASASLDEGESWSPDIVLGSSQGSNTVDKPWFTVDTSNSSWAGHFYVVWATVDHDSSGNEIATNIMLSTSSDGTHFTPPRAIVRGDHFAGLMPYAVVDPTGDLYIFWANFYTQPSPINMIKSVDGGQTFSSPKTVASAIGSLPGRHGGRGALPGTQFPAWSNPSVAVDSRTGFLYLVWADNRNGDADIFFTNSIDHGATWLTPKRLNDDPLHNGKDQFHPAVATSNDGAVHVVFLDRRDDPNNIAYRVYYTVSMDNGKSFASNMMISDVGSNANQLPDPTYIGAYIGITVGPNRVVHVAWNDCRNNQLEAFTASFSLTSNGAIVTSTSSAPPSITVATSSTQLEQISPVGPQQTMSMGVLPIAGGLVAVIVVAVAAVFTIMRRRKTTSSTRLEQPLVETETLPPQPGISTGYAELDQLLIGGLPEGHSILILSASWDERDLLLRRIIRSCVSTSRPVFYVSNDISTTQELVREYSKDFCAFSEQADKIKSEHANLFKVPGVGNLSEFNISLGVALKDAHVAPEANKVMVLDVVSDALLRHKSLTTLRWLTDLIAKRKTEKFTILATLNPLSAPKEETQPIIDLFDGVIQIYEKELAERTRRFIVIKKMRGRRYLETDLMLDRNKLF